MNEVTQSTKLFIAVLMIVTGAFDTLGQAFLTQSIKLKTNNLSIKETSINISSIPSCKYEPLQLGRSHVSRLIFSFSSVLSSQS